MIQKNNQKEKSVKNNKSDCNSSINGGSIKNNNRNNKNNKP